MTTPAHPSRGDLLGTTADDLRRDALGDVTLSQDERDDLLDRADLEDSENEADTTTDSAGSQG